MKCESYEKPTTFLCPLPSQIVCPVIALLSLLVAGHVCGQGSPFGATSPPEEPPAATTEGDSNEPSEFDKQVAAETDPLVLAILEAKPTTPDQWIHDVQTLLNLNRAFFAKEYLTQFLNLNPNEADLIQIQARYGSALFIRLSSTPELQPEGTAVASAVMKAAADQQADAARLAALVTRLSDQNPAARNSAAKELVKIGSPAAVPMIAALGDEGRQSEHAAVRMVLRSLGNEAIPPLIATLNSAKPSLRREALSLLGSLESLKAVPFVLRMALGAEQPADEAEAARKMLQEVLGDVPSRAEAGRFLSRRLENYLAGSAPGPIDQDDQVTVWIWDSTAQIPRLQTLPAADASFLAAALVAEQLHRIDPDEAKYTRMHLATGVEVAKRLNGYSRPLTPEMGTIYQNATSADAGLLEEVLQLALKEKMQGAAIAMIDLLGQTKSVELLRSANDQPRLLAKSLVSPIPRVKFAAARAIVTIDPIHPYAGSSYLPEVLAYMSASGGERRVLVGHPRTEDAQRLAGYFNVLGFVVDTQQTGRSLALQASKNPDYSFALIHDAIDRPGYRELVQMLRRDPRSANLPVGLLVREFNRESAEWFAKTDALTIDLAPPQTQADVAADTRRLLTAAGRNQVLPDERMSHAIFALDTLAQLAADSEKYRFYDLLPLDQRIEKTLSKASLTPRAAKVLGLLGTPTAQRALVEFASTQTHTLAHRQAAAAAFRIAVSRRGLLLTSSELLKQYDLYNASEFLDNDAQQVMASILDTIEAPSQSPESAKNDE